MRVVGILEICPPFLPFTTPFPSAELGSLHCAEWSLSLFSNGISRGKKGRSANDSCVIYFSWAKIPFTIFIRSIGIDRQIHH